MVNLVVMALLLAGGAHYVVAAVLAAEISILDNFLMQERFVFGDLRGGRHSFVERAVQSIGFNTLEALVRLPFLVVLVEAFAINEVLAQGLTIALAFAARYLFVAKVVYKPQAVMPAAEPQVLGAAA